LELLVASVELGVDDLFYLPFWFPFYDFWWGLFIVGSMRFSFSIPRQKVHMKDWVDVHCRGEF
jgi:hypothetical protein